MFKTGDTVVHAAEGICRIEGVEKKTFDGKTDEYYVLRAVGDERSTVYIPVETVRLNPKIRLVLTKTQIHEIIGLIPAQEPIKCENDNTRRKRFREILSGGNCAEIAQLIGTIHGMKKQIRQSGKKPKVTDERIIRETESSVCGEFSYTLGIPPEDVPFYIEKGLGKC